MEKPKNMSFQALKQTNQKLKQNPDLSDHNKEVLNNFFRHKKTSVGGAHLEEISSRFNALSSHIDFPLDDPEKKDLEKLIGAINHDEVTREDGKAYSEYSKDSLYKTLSNFYTIFKDYGDWFDDFENPANIQVQVEPEKIPSLEQIREIASQANNQRDEALALFGWALGARIGELLYTRETHKYPEGITRNYVNISPLKFLMKRRKGQYARARRRNAQSKARQDRIVRTAVLLDIGFNIDEVAALLEMSKSTIYDYKNDIEHNEHPTSDGIEQIKSLQSSLEILDISEKEAARLYIKVAENFLDDFNSVDEFCSAFEHELKAEDLEYEEMSYREINELMRDFVSRRDAYIKRTKLSLYGGATLGLIGLLFGLSGLIHLIINFDPLGAASIIVGVVLMYFGLEIAIYSEGEYEEIEKFLLDD